MGCCLSKKGSEPEEHIGYRHVAGAGGAGVYNNHKSHEPFATQTKPPPHQPYQLPEKHAPPQAPWRPPPSPKHVHNHDTITGKPFEDVKQHYTLGKELGRGQFGVTYLCTENSTGLQYACKSISRRKLVSRADKEDMKREIQIMQHLSGQSNIVEFKGAFEDKQSVHVVMELCAGGELFDRIIAKGHYSERAAASICRQIVKVVNTCHFMGVIHRDLKPENFLLSSKDDKGLLKATDFGLSVFIEEGKVYRNIVGSAYYVAPEVLRRSYGKEADIWSAGVILYILLSGVPPFWAETEKGIFDAILQGHIDFESSPWPSISNSAKDLVRKMLIKDPKKRITAAQVLEHPWLKEGGNASDKPIDSAVLSRLISLILSSSSNNSLQLPPSPPSIPLLGHLHHLTPSLYKSLYTLSSKHGPLLLLRLGPSRRLLLLVSSAAVATDVFKTHDLAFSSRPAFAFAERLPFGTSGFVTAPYGPYWRFMKKLCVTELLSTRQLERSRSIRREEILRSIKRVIDNARETVALDLGSEFTKFTNNVTCRTAMSTSCAEKCEDAERIRKLVKESFELAAKLCFGDVLGPFKELSFWVYGKKAIDMSTRYDELLEEVLKEHEHKRLSRANGDQSERDLMDILLDVYHDAHAEFKITMAHIKAFFMDLFIAGTHTSAEATQWAMAELLNHPEAFQKVRKEIELVTGNVRLVDESDITNLPYLQAVVKETLRLYPPAPITTRECRQHCKINSFDVPPKTAVAINLYAIMRDPDSWDNPNEFCPERFLQEQDHEDLSDDGKRMKFNFVPFGGGRRGCPGTALAFSLMNTAVAAMVQCFDWKIGKDGKGEKVDMESGSGMSLSMVHPLICVPVVHFIPYDI